MKRFYKQQILIICFLTFLFSGCDNDIQSPIPDYPVHLELNLTSTYPNFKAPNEALMFDHPILATDRIGFGGILVYCGFDNNYYAFDMCCPYEIKNTVRVYPNDKGQAVCRLCGTVYDISYGLGNPISGPSKELLKRYKVTQVSDILYVSHY